MSQSFQSPFVVDALRPEGLGGRAAGVYQLTNASVSPRQIVGRDELGLPIEDTVPPGYWRAFVHPSGAINKVPLRTAAVFSNEPEAERYEQLQVRELVASGWIPLNACPYSYEYSHATGGGAFVKVPEGEKDCGGHPSGCVHLRKVIEARTKAARKKHDDDERALNAMKHEDTQRMIDAVATGVGEAISRNSAADMAAARGRLRTGKGEKEE